jgi:hypothetical protein
MGIYKEGILGFFRGKVGSVVGSVIRGVHYMRGLGDFRADNPSPAQLDQRVKFALMTAFLKPLKSLIAIGFQTGKTGLTSANLALSANLKQAISGVSPNFAVDYAKVMYSQGSLAKGLGAGLVTQDNEKLQFNWDLKGDEAGTDLATVMVYNPTQKTYVVLSNAALRSAKTFVLQLPTDFTDQVVHGWISFVSADKKRVSDSLYLGQLIVV